MPIILTPKDPLVFVRKAPWKSENEPLGEKKNQTKKKQAQLSGQPIDLILKYIQNLVHNKSPARTMQEVMNIMVSAGWGQLIKDRFQIEFLLVWRLSLILQGVHGMLLNLLNKVEV